jgi:pimeloyl-ACP methyl ester carboxylesterase
MVGERDVQLGDGRVLHAYDSGPDAAARLVLTWHHGSPQTGAPLEPRSGRGGARHPRALVRPPSYGRSSPNPGRDVASSAADVAAVADAFGVDRFAAMGASRGGPHALAGAALLPERVTGVVSIAGIAPLQPADASSAALSVGPADDFSAPCWSVHRIPTHGRMTPCGN